MSRKSFVLVSFCFVLILLSACNDNYIFNKSIDLENAVWAYNDTLVYDFEIKDTIQPYQLFLNINHSPDFAAQNIYSRIYTQFPDGTNAVDTISLELLDNFGSWLGKCNQTTCDLDLLLQSNTRFKASGKYSIRLEQYNRIDSIKGIQSIGFMIANVKP
jgi:gliding motility-associated lipoprotein GldH